MVFPLFCSASAADLLEITRWFNQCFSLRNDEKIFHTHAHADSDERLRLKRCQRKFTKLNLPFCSSTDTYPCAIQWWWDIVLVNNAPPLRCTLSCVINVRTLSLFPKYFSLCTETEYSIIRAQCTTHHSLATPSTTWVQRNVFGKLVHFFFCVNRKLCLW